MSGFFGSVGLELGFGSGSLVATWTEIGRSPVFCSLSLSLFPCLSLESAQQLSAGRARVLIIDHSCWLFRFRLGFGSVMLFVWRRSRRCSLTARASSDLGTISRHQLESSESFVFSYLHKVGEVCGGRR